MLKVEQESNEGPSSGLAATSQASACFTLTCPDGIGRDRVRATDPVDVAVGDVVPGAGRRPPASGKGGRWRTPAEKGHRS